MTDKSKLTKAETTALWYAVQCMCDCVQAMRSMDFTPEQIEAERARLKVATHALRKVNKIRARGL